MYKNLVLKNKNIKKVILFKNLIKNNEINSFSNFFFSSQNLNLNKTLKNII